MVKLSSSKKRGRTSARRGEKLSTLARVISVMKFVFAIGLTWALYTFIFQRNAEVSQLMLSENQQQQKQQSATKSVEASLNQYKNPNRGEAAAAVTHKVAGLSCSDHSSPIPDEDVQGMVYWSDIPSDSHFESPFKKVGPTTKYLTFEPDEGGWNNIRMSMETAVTMALAMGRTLVLPPEQGIYLLHKADQGQKNRFTFKDFFHFDSVETEHPNLDVITFEEFLKREAMTGQLKNTATGAISFPPENRTNWDGKFVNYEAGKKGVFPWLRTVTKTIDWDWEKCIAGFPKNPGAEGARQLEAEFDIAKSKIQDTGLQKRIDSFTNNPTPVDAPPEARIRELLATRHSLCLYDDGYQQAKFVHAMGDNDSGARMLSHFYAFLFFEDWRHDLWTKRFVRDHLRYVDKIQCYAASFVSFLRKKARQFNIPNGDFYTMHIRRGDFQYKDTRIEAAQILESVRDVIPAQSVLYIATDETDRSFFKGFSEQYRVYYIDSNPPLIKGLNTNFLGMFDQLVASRGTAFVGTYYSTFTGYINRMRGYHSQRDKAPGYEKGEINSFYYVPKQMKIALKEYRSVSPPYWAREFPIGMLLSLVESSMEFVVFAFPGLNGANSFSHQFLLQDGETLTRVWKVDTSPRMQE